MMVGVVAGKVTLVVASKVRRRHGSIRGVGGVSKKRVKGRLGVGSGRYLSHACRGMRRVK